MLSTAGLEIVLANSDDSSTFYLRAVFHYHTVLYRINPLTTAIKMII
jgi:hypothetical protein